MGDVRETARTRPELARLALLVTAAVYLGYGLLGLLGVSSDLRYLGLVGSFYWLPGWILRRDPARAQRWEVGPDSPVPAWSWIGARWAGLLAVTVFPLFALGFFAFYQHICAGERGLLSPVVAVEAMTPLAGGLDRLLDGLCRAHTGTLWPGAWHVPVPWTRWGGLGLPVAIAVEIFAIALPEEVFHRGFLMSALEERWPPRRQIFGAPLGLAAVVASLVFAVGHLVGMAQLGRLATFFPALLFSWLWRKSGSLWAPALFHAAANLLMSLLLASTFPS